MVNWQVFLINLDHSTERLQESTRQLQKHNIAFERLPAIWGGDLNQHCLDRVYPKHSKDYYKKLNPGEIGCYLSHIKAWQTICDRKLDFALVLEDDFLIVENFDFKEIIKTIENLQQGWHYIKLGGFHKQSDIIFQSTLGNYQLATFKKVPNRTCSQFVSLLGAQRLLRHCLPLRRPIDVDLRYWWEKRIYVQALLPYTFIPNTKAESEILKFSLRKNAPKRSMQGFRDKAAYYYYYNKEGKALQDFLQNLQKYNTPYKEEKTMDLFSLIDIKEPAES